MDLEGPEGPDLVRTDANWSNWAGIMVTRHFDLVSGSTAACYISLLTWRGNIAWGGNPLQASVDQKWSCKGQT